jgi:hypothetical protein
MTGVLSRGVCTHSLILGVVLAFVLGVSLTSSCNAKTARAGETTAVDFSEQCKNL